MTWKEAARRFRRRWRNVEHNHREAVGEIQSWHAQCQVARTHAARFANQVAVVATLVKKYRKREMPARDVIVAIDDMLRENGTTL